MTTSSSVSQTFGSFFVRLLTFSVMIAGIAYALYATIFKAYYLTVLPFLLVFIMATTSVFHYFMLKAGHKRFNAFANSFIGFTSIKLLLYLIFIMIYLFVQTEGALIFVLNFFILYMAYTIFEIVLLLGAFKKTDHFLPTQQKSEEQ